MKNTLNGKKISYFTDNMDIDSTLIKDNATIPVYAGTREFIEIEVNDNSDFNASLKGGKVSLYDLNFNLLEQASESLDHRLKKGEYILLADNGTLSTSSDLKIFYAE